MGLCHSESDDFARLGAEADENKRKKIFDNLWETYDKDKNGYLDEKELQPALVRVHSPKQ